MTRTCLGCGRTLVNRKAWRDMTDEQRRALYPTHAQAERRDSCATCRDAGRIYSDDELAYEGGWVRRGLILVPVKRGAA